MKMRAHFAGDVEQNSSRKRSATNAENNTSPGHINFDYGKQKPEDKYDTSLEERINECKTTNPNDVKELIEFVDEILLKAEQEVVKQTQKEIGENTSLQAKEKSRHNFAMPDFKNGKVVHRARGLVVRLFDAICNCANTATGPAQRIKLRGKRANSTATAAATRPDDATATATAVGENTTTEGQSQAQAQ